MSYGVDWGPVTSRLIPPKKGSELFFSFWFGAKQTKNTHRSGPVSRFLRQLVLQFRWSHAPYRSHLAKTCPDLKMCCVNAAFRTWSLAYLLSDPWWIVIVRENGLNYAIHTNFSTDPDPNFLSWERAFKTCFPALHLAPSDFSKYLSWCLQNF